MNLISIIKRVGSPIVVKGNTRRSCYDSMDLLASKGKVAPVGEFKNLNDLILATCSIMTK